ncbi:MAG: hypothetical protein LC650_04515 [Actinobacteria bacterium]|nr:hypothetical protein [Actinomycetota bacterium]
MTKREMAYTIAVKLCGFALGKELLDYEVTELMKRKKSEIEELYKLAVNA